MIDELFVRYKRIRKEPWYIERSQLILEKDKRNLFHKSEFCLIEDLHKFSLYPNLGNVYIKRGSNEIEYITRLDQMLFNFEHVYHLDNMVTWSCKTTDIQNSQFKLLCIGRDTFANLLINLRDFIDKHNVILLSDIIICLEYDMFNAIFMKYLNKNGRPSRLLIRERFDE